MPTEVQPPVCPHTGGFFVPVRCIIRVFSAPYDINMTKQGIYNLLAILGLPVAAVLAAWIGTEKETWNAYFATYRWLFIVNLVFMLLFGLICGVMLRRSSTEKSRWVAIVPTLVTAGAGAGTYLWYAFVPPEVAAGAELLGAPQYLAVLGLGLIVFVLLLRVTGIVKRTA